MQKGDVVMRDNPADNRGPKAAAILKDISTWFRFRAKPSNGRQCCPANLPPCSPDLNPVEMVFARIKTPIRKAAARHYDQLWQAVANLCGIFHDDECDNFFKAAGYDTN